MELKGTIKQINETQEISSSFKKRELVITTNEDYPQDILVQFIQDKCDILSNYKNGDNVSVGINLRGKEWTNPQGEVKHFNTIQGWKISKDELPVKLTNPKEPSNNDGNDLPF